MSRRTKTIFVAGIMLFSLLAFYLNHGCYQIFLGLTSVVLAYAISCMFVKNKVWMIIFFFLLAVVICQLSVTTRAVLRNEENSPNTVSSVLGDVVHGFKRMPEVGVQIYEAFKGINGRYATVLLMIPLGIGGILFKPE